MSVSSEFVVHCKNKNQIKVIESFPKKLTGRGQNHPISKEMKISGMDVSFLDCFCIDDFEKIIPKLCIYLAEKTPENGYKAEGEFCEETDGYEMHYSVVFSRRKLRIVTLKGYPTYDDNDMDTDDVAGLKKSEKVYSFIDEKLVEDGNVGKKTSCREKKKDEDPQKDFSENIEFKIQKFREGISVTVHTEGRTVHVPSVIKQKNVVEVAFWGNNAPNVERIEIEEGVECFEARAMNKLKDISFPKSIEKVCLEECKCLENEEGLIIFGDRLYGRRRQKTEYAKRDSYEGVFIAPCRAIVDYRTLPLISYVGERKNSVMPSLHPTHVGDIVKIGEFPQTKTGDLKSIEWEILKKDGDRVLLVSKKAIVITDFTWGGDPWEKKTWKSSKIRKWLNTDFYDFAFNDIEKSCIEEIITDNQGSITKDKVFLLSKEEVEEFMKEKKDRVLSKNKITQYASKNNPDGWKDIFYRDKITAWWLRTVENDVAVVVDDKGNFSDNRGHAWCVRPAIWIRTE